MFCSKRRREQFAETQAAILNKQHEMHKARAEQRHRERKAGVDMILWLGSHENSYKALVREAAERYKAGNHFWYALLLGNGSNEALTAVRTYLMTCNITE